MEQFKNQVSEANIRKDRPVDDVLIATIVARVMAILSNGGVGVRSRRVLALFSGASAGQVAGLKVIEQLTRTGHTVTAVLSPTASYMIGEERLRSAGVHQVVGPGTWADAPGMVRETNLVLLPALSMNFAAHLAMGLLDSLPATLVIGALLAGKPVVAVRDGADPDGSAGKVFGANGSAPALRARLSGNLKTLAAYGVELVSEADFPATVQRHLTPTLKLLQPAQNPERNGAQIVTQADIAHLAHGSVLRLPPGSRLTPLASETIARLSIQVVYE